MENNQKPSPTDSNVINSKITNGEVKLPKHAGAKEAPREKKEASKEKKPKESKKEPEQKKKAEKVEKEFEFPAAARINAYGFLNFRKRLLDALGWTKGQKLTIEQNADGSATLRKT